MIKYVSVTTTTSYPAANAPSFDCSSEFRPRKIRIANADATNRVLFSFDGTTDHGELLNGSGPGSCIDLEFTAATKIWLKGSAGTPRAFVIAEA